MSLQPMSSAMAIMMFGRLDANAVKVNANPSKTGRLRRTKKMYAFTIIRFFTAPVLPK